MGKYSKVIKQVKFGWRLAENGWADMYCENCGWTENLDMHVGYDYKFCPGCGGSVEGDRMKYNVRYARKIGEVHCGNCDELLGWYGDKTVSQMDFCPYCGEKFEKDYIQYLREKIDLA